MEVAYCVRGRPPSPAVTIRLCAERARGRRVSNNLISTLPTSMESTRFDIL
jgi:hypothetical protein